MKSKNPEVPVFILSDDEECKAIAIASGCDLAAMIPIPPKNESATVFAGMVRGRKSHCILLFSTVENDSGYVLMAAPFEAISLEEFAEFILANALTQDATVVAASPARN